MTLLAIDTATAQAVIAVGSADRVLGTRAWQAGHRHGETLLAAIETLLAETGVDRRALGGIVVGTGPGAFTGLRVGVATAKGLAHGLGVPLVGVGSGVALLAGAAVERPVLLLPAGPSDRVLVRAGTAPRLLPAGTEPDLATGEALVAVDLVGRASPDALARGETARTVLGPTLLALGAARLAEHHDGELATLVPEYVTLPRGARPTDGTVAWSRDPR